MSLIYTLSEVTNPINIQKLSICFIFVLRHSQLWSQLTLSSVCLGFFCSFCFGLGFFCPVCRQKKKFNKNMKDSIGNFITVQTWWDTLRTMDFTFIRNALFLTTIHSFLLAIMVCALYTPILVAPLHSCFSRSRWWPWLQSGDACTPMLHMLKHASGMFFHSLTTSLADQKSLHPHCWFGGLLIGEVGGGSVMPHHSFLFWSWEPHPCGCVFGIYFVCLFHVRSSATRWLSRYAQVFSRVRISQPKDLNGSSFLTRSPKLRRELCWS